ncbi:unnamed protein product, partial [marine sediment metagenome]
MSGLNAEVMSSGQCVRAFRRAVWGFLFFLPFQMRPSGADMTIEILPDALAWGILLFAMNPIAGLHPVVVRLRRLAAAGLFLSLPRVVSFHPAQAAWACLYLVVCVLGAVVAVLFVWQLCDLIAEMAAHAENNAVRRNA